MRISAGAVSRVATLAGNQTARAIWDALPLEGRANRWGNEIYFAVPVALAEDQAQEVVSVGDIAYWPPGHAVCIFWGRTPASEGEEPRAASPVNVFGHVADQPTEFASVTTGAVVRLERA